MLELRNITYEVDDNNENKEILKNVSVTIDDHFVAITGPNGGGKSTLAKMIAGIIRPTSGQILLDGEDITGLNITERARKGISFAFQQPVHFKGLTVKDLITIAAHRSHSEFFGFCWYPAGIVCHRSIYLWFGYSDYLRTEYRNLCHSDDLSNRCKPGRKENRIRAFIFQHYRNLIIPYSILYWKCNLSF